MKYNTYEQYEENLYPSHLQKINYCQNGHVDTTPTVVKCLLHYCKSGEIKDHSDVTSAIETGTFSGATSMHLAGLFENVHTVEKYPQYHGFEHYSAIKKQFSNIHFYNGNSPSFIEHILTQSPTERFFIWLDAHNGTSEVPLIQELNSINTFSTRKDHIICIDDGPDMGHQNFPNHEQIVNALHEINPGYRLTETAYGRGIHIALL